MEEFGEEAVFELWFGGHIEEFEVGEVELFLDESDGVVVGEDLVAKFEFVPGEALEFFDGGFEVGGDA